MYTMFFVQQLKNIRMYADISLSCARNAQMCVQSLYSVVMYISTIICVCIESNIHDMKLWSLISTLFSVSRSYCRISSIAAFCKLSFHCTRMHSNSTLFHLAAAAFDTKKLCNSSLKTFAISVECIWVLISIDDVGGNRLSTRIAASPIFLLTY